MGHMTVRTLIISFSLFFLCCHNLARCCSPSLIADILLLLVPRQGGGSCHQAAFAFPTVPERKGTRGVGVSREKCLRIQRRCMLLTHLCTSREEMRQRGREIFLHTSDVHCSGHVILAVLPKVVFLLPSVSACFIAGCPLNSTIISPSQTLHWTRTAHLFLCDGGIRVAFKSSEMPWFLG